MSGGETPRGLGRSTRSTGYRARTYYVPDELHFRLRNAWWATHTLPEEHDSVSEAVSAALEAEVTRLETRYNDGQPFPEMPADKRPKGAGPRGRARQAEAMVERAARRAAEKAEGP